MKLFVSYLFVYLLCQSVEVVVGCLLLLLFVCLFACCADLFCEICRLCCMKHSVAVVRATERWWACWLLPDDTMQYQAVFYGTMQYHTIPYYTILYHTIPCNIIQCLEISCNTILYQQPTERHDSCSQSCMISQRPNEQIWSLTSCRVILR